MDSDYMELYHLRKQIDRVDCYGPWGLLFTLRLSIFLNYAIATIHTPHTPISYSLSPHLYLPVPYPPSSHSFQ